VRARESLCGCVSQRQDPLLDKSHRHMIVQACVCVCVCAYMCVGKGDRERERECVCVYINDNDNLSNL